MPKGEKVDWDRGVVGIVRLGALLRVTGEDMIV